MTTDQKVAQTWCRLCGTRHEQADECPGELLAVGVERHGWRGLADTPRGPEVYGTLVAAVAQGWRARILTFPNILWVARDPRVGTMKFLGATPGQAEKQATAYIRAICKRAGFTLRTELPYVESAKVDPEQTASAEKSEAIRAAARKLKRVSIRFGIGRPNQDAETDDLSEGGLFILTPQPLPIGTDLRLFLETENLGIPLKGIVRWTRDKEIEGRPVGMGIKLTAPHPRYVHFVRHQQTAPATPAAQREGEESVELELYEASGELEEWNVDLD